MELVQLGVCMCLGQKFAWSTSQPQFVFALPKEAVCMYPRDGTKSSSIQQRDLREEHQNDPMYMRMEYLFVSFSDFSYARDLVYNTVPPFCYD